MEPFKSSSSASAACATLLEVQGLSRRFGGMAAVDDVSFAVERGGITGLIGPNGAGKTTCFNLIAGSLAPSSGRILLDGRPISHEPAHRRIGRGLARTFQIPRPFPAMTVRENLLLAAQDQPGERIWPNWLRGGEVALVERRNRDAADAILAFLTLAPHADAPARVLSGGQRKLLELGRVLMTKPRLILLDEPAAGVSPVLLDVIGARIIELCQRGITFLLVEHNMDLVRRLCDRVHVMAAGRLLMSGRPDEVTVDARVVEAYLGSLAA